LDRLLAAISWLVQVVIRPRAAIIVLSVMKEPIVVGGLTGISFGAWLP
jgi:hypothetical protein